MNQASGSFHNTDWREETVEEYEGGAKLTRAHIVQDFAGGLAATGTWEMLMSYRPDGTAVYVGFVRFEGTLDGRAGSAVGEATGSYDGNEARSTWSIVKGSETGGWRGLDGRGTAVAPHGPDGTFTFDYRIEKA